MKKISLIFIATLFIGFIGCTTEPDTDPVPEYDNISIVINHTLGESELELGTDYILPSNEFVSFSKLSYFLSNFYLVRSDDSKLILDDNYAFIQAKSDENSITLDNIPMGVYKGIGFSLGLDSAINHGNPNAYDTDHPLAPINNSQHWNWQGGYIFTALEGKTLANNESFIFHIAGAQNRIDYNFPLNFTKNEQALNATFSYNIAEVFQNPNAYNIAEDGASTHSTTDPVTLKLIENMADIFTLVSVN